MSRQFNADATVIEDTGLGRAVHQDLQDTGQIRTLLHTPRFDKGHGSSLNRLASKAGRSASPREAPWLGAYVSELLAFPNRRFDDQVDSTS